MGCPVHIWVPMMAAFAPFARVARDRFLPSKPRFSKTANGTARTVQRFAPITPGGSAKAATQATAEQAR